MPGARPVSESVIETELESKKMCSERSHYSDKHPIRDTPKGWSLSDSVIEMA
jgi:hypothetical protein